jgi:hypothetical protein
MDRPNDGPRRLLGLSIALLPAESFLLDDLIWIRISFYLVKGKKSARLGSTTRG